MRKQKPRPDAPPVSMTRKRGSCYSCARTGCSRDLPPARWTIIPSLSPNPRTAAHLCSSSCASERDDMRRRRSRWPLQRPVGATRWSVVVFV